MTETLRKNMQGPEADTQGEPVAQSSGDLAKEYAANLVRLGVCQEDAERQARYMTDPEALAHRAEIEGTINAPGQDAPVATSRIPDYKVFIANLTITGERAVQEAAAAVEVFRPRKQKPVVVEKNPAAGNQTVFAFRRSR